MKKDQILGASKLDLSDNNNFYPQRIELYYLDRNLFEDNQYTTHIYKFILLLKINIGFGVRKKVEESVSKAEAKLFDEAYECIFKLLESDSFVRFKVFTNNQ